MDILPQLLIHLAWIKLVFFVGMFLLIFLFARNHEKPLDYLIIITIMYSALAYLVVWPHATLLFGNVGDELYVGANLARMVHGGFGDDMYYASLPPYYPPLWFWIVGGVSSLVAAHGLVAYKIGAILGMAGLFLGTYAWLASAQRLRIVNSFFGIRILIPVCVTLFIPFDALIGKPHEALAAVLSVLLLAAFIRLTDLDESWHWTQFVFMGVSVGMVLMMYYFWLIVLAPIAVFVALMSGRPWSQIGRAMLVGVIGVVVALPYLYPLAQSLMQHGVAAAQGTFFSVRDIQFHGPWESSPLGGVYAIFALCAVLLFRRLSLVRAALFVIVGSYVYQAVGLALFVSGVSPLLPSKSFEYLTGVAWAIGLAYSLVAMVAWVEASRRLYVFVASLCVALVAIGMPFLTLVDDEAFIERMNRNTLVPQEMVLADAIRAHVPDWDERVWLAATRPAVNIYLPLTYYLGHNEHYSHFAAGFRGRLNRVERLASSGTPEQFYRRFVEIPDSPSALLVFYDERENSYPLDVWIDNFPNGGAAHRVSLPAHLISEPYFRRVYDSWGWRIFVLDRRAEIGYTAPAL